MERNIYIYSIPILEEKINNPINVQEYRLRLIYLLNRNWSLHRIKKLINKCKLIFLYTFVPILEDGSKYYMNISISYIYIYYIRDKIRLITIRLLYLQLFLRILELKIFINRYLEEERKDRFFLSYL